MRRTKNCYMTLRDTLIDTFGGRNIRQYIFGGHCFWNRWINLKRTKAIHSVLQDAFITRVFHSYQH